ncbi:MAG: formylglycine-generating enzyme family protein [Saprospiraceae bacterium]|nr:formylglycine-generating enzyme family protein [Saprospiraceae bacterium]MDW8484404.1 formylglycine-generating enzyme family protein [Saprospiraceae bacterium]
MKRVLLFSPLVLIELCLSIWVEAQETDFTTCSRIRSRAPEMVLIRGGSFTMGCTPEQHPCWDDEKPAGRVTVGDFYLGKYEVTFEEYDAFCEATGRPKPYDWQWGRGRRPVVDVSWFDVVAYCNWLSEQEGLEPVYTIDGAHVRANWNAKGYRLPTEAEWEYAARGGGKAVPFGNGKSRADYKEINFKPDFKHGVFSPGEYREQTIPTGSLGCPNALDLHDMSGNVWEWCWDWFGPYPRGARTDYRGPENGITRVIRGGSWASSPPYIRTAYRSSYTPAGRTNDIGFRLARTP